jgi:shikimate dehydrogenase
MGGILTLEEVASLNPESVHLGVLGFPIKHSLSPVFQNAALNALSLQHLELSHWKYHGIEVRPDALKSALYLLPRVGFKGVNLTIPHKVDAMAMIDGFEGIAEKIGAVNTLSFEDGKIIGRNTDGVGMEKAIRMKLGIELTDRTIVMMGAGGASRGACVQCLESGCERLYIANRSKTRLDALLSSLSEYYPDRSIKGIFKDNTWPELDKETLVVNATSLGLNPGDPIPISKGNLERIGYLFDMVYGPNETRLVRMARDAGVHSVDGLSMLVLQGASSVERWTGHKAPVDIMFESVKDLGQP